MDYGSEAGHSKSKILVLIMVLAAIAVLGVVAYIGFTRRAGGGGTAAAAEGDLGRWCALRSEWGKKVSSLEADIILKSVRAEDEKERKALIQKRGQICQDYAEQVRKLTVTDPRISKVEVALVKEGKVRANVSVEIANAASMQASDDIAKVRKAKSELKKRIVQRIQEGKAAADREIAAAIGSVNGCEAIYRGPMTDKGTADDPYISWRELEMRRKQALATVDGRLKELEPREQYANQIYHELIRKYGKVLRKCYQGAKRKHRTLASKGTFLVRLKGNGQVKSMGAVTDPKRFDSFLDCLMAKASKWKLPPPVKSGEAVLVNVDFSRI